MSYTTLAINLNNNAVTQYINFEYDSFVIANNILLGANSDGIFKLEQDSHDQAQIDAYFKTGLFDFGSPNQKRIRFISLGYEANDKINVTIIDDENDEHANTIEFSENSLALSGSKGYSVSSQNGKYYQFKIANTNGGKFSIEDMYASIIKLRSKSVS